jgi:hypothetical protein
MTQDFYNQYSELINILDCIVDVPENMPDYQKAEYLNLFQKHTRKALAKLNMNPDEPNSTAIQA